MTADLVVSNAQKTVEKNGVGRVCEEAMVALNIRQVTVVTADARGCVYSYKEMKLDEFGLDLSGKC